MGVLRWQSKLDATLEAAGAKKAQFAKFDPEVLIALRMGVLQLRFLERVPESAAVNESVELVKRARKRSAAGLVNALLRKVASLPADSEKPLASLDSAKAIAEEFAHPFWLVERWAAQFGLEAVAQICRQNQQVPPVSLPLCPVVALWVRLLDPTATRAPGCVPPMSHVPKGIAR